MTDAHFAAESNAQETLAAPLLSLPFLDPLVGGGDTWIRVGDYDTDEERTVTVVFRHDPLDPLELVDPLEDLETGEFQLQPLAPMFPGR